MFIFQIDAGKVLQVQNTGETSKSKDTPDAALLKSLSGGMPELNGVCLGCPPHLPPFPPGGYVPPNNQIPPAMLFGKIVDLANEYIIYAQTHPYSRAIPPWERSNELFDTLAQYTGTHVNNESVKALKDFFYNIQIKEPNDPNQDGKLDHNDVLNLWNPTPIFVVPLKSQQQTANRLVGLDGSNGGQEPVTKGDINGDGKVDQQDIQCLYSIFPEANVNQDNKLDQEDYNMLKKSIEEGHPIVIHIGGPMGPDHIVGDVNRDNKIDEKDLDLLQNTLNVGDMNNDKQVDDKDLELLKEMVDKPIQIPEIIKFFTDVAKGNSVVVWTPKEEAQLFDALEKITGISSKIGDARRQIILDLIYHNNGLYLDDYNCDGEVDYKDLIDLYKMNSKGDFNDDGIVGRGDLAILKLVLRCGDLDGNKKLDQEDYKILKEIINKTGSTQPSVSLPQVGDITGDNKVDNKDLDLLGKILRLGDMDGNGSVDKTDRSLLAKLTPPLPPFPRSTSIYLGGDSNIPDYVIYQPVAEEDEILSILDVKNHKEVDSISGVDLKKLSDRIQQIVSGAKPYSFFNFSEDVNGDGKVDQIRIST